MWFKDPPPKNPKKHSAVLCRLKMNPTSFFSGIDCTLFMLSQTDIRIHSLICWSCISIDIVVLAHIQY